MPQCLRQKDTPWQQPGQQQTPEDEEWHGVIAGRHALVQKSQDVLVDKVEPEETAHGSLARISQRRQNMPRRGKCKKNQRAREEPQLQHMTEVSREQQVQTNCTCREDETNQALSEHVQCADSSEAPASQA